MPEHGDHALCLCGAYIEYVVLPSDLAAIFGAPGFWKHHRTGERHCYLTLEGLPFDGALAEPDPGEPPPEWAIDTESVDG